MYIVQILFSILLPWHIALAAKGGLTTPTEWLHEIDADVPSFHRTDEEPVPPITSDLDSSDNVTRNFVSATLGSNMVLQRDQEVTIWGYSQKGALITTSLFDHEEDEAKEARFILSTTANGDDGLWRQTLPPQSASLKPMNIDIKSSSGQRQTLENVLFGDVYLWGGQSNMVFSLPGTTNGTEEANKGNNYPHIRIFTVGQKTTSSTPLPDLQSIAQKWSVAKNHSLYYHLPGVPGGRVARFSFFSSVCWFFGKEVADGLENKVPIGLISDNWGGTAVQRWKPNGDLYNAMIYPYMVGPMAVTGFTWYQGEANAHNMKQAKLYRQLFPEMIEAWRSGFKVPDAYFGFVQLSTWCSKVPEAVAEIRRSQMAALQLKNVGYSTNADMGAGCDIHPPKKQFCGYRLGNSALAIQYGKPIHWKSPSYSKATALVNEERQKKTSANPSVVVQFQDVSSEGLYLLKTPYNTQVENFACAANPAGTCAGATVLLNGKGWVNATITIRSSNSVSLTAVTGDSSQDLIVATSYGWGSVPLMTVYDKGTDLPVLPWNERM
ncbi:Sialate O-acetylesterase [Seminavis robusta]|uniref:Sialate O-acetylesterase n=1 Tax=Seminavis robusta TaxID=568900 RepID=A0A9N8DBS6_9STRA|nr:Sialate O-acetylesterase [Seminavis robusta]|eukprot:Sro80_g043110.1 Sialate O-acetylesterase (550) ;mRNA; f:63850-65499